MSDDHNTGIQQSMFFQYALYLLVIIASAVAGFVSYQAYRYDFTTLSGEQYKWDEFKDELIVINYFAQWCAPCLREMPELNALAENLPENTHLFAIDYDRQPKEKLLEMVIANNIGVEILIPKDDTVLPFPFPDTLPTTYIINAEGRVLKTIQGEVTQARLRQELSLL